MGYAIAEELASQGAEVILVSGPTHLDVSNPLITKISIQTAQEMYNESVKYFPECDAAIMSAAVADFKPEIQFDEKVKRGKENMQISLEPNKDIAAELGVMKNKNQILVGFALETNNEIENAKLKVKNKNLDFIVLNSLNEKGAGFGHDTNKISIIDNQDNLTKFDLKLKKDVAIDIVEALIEKLSKS
jgi:phosphopantothenoylcysteine decarboxylase/phosphopantothenate--cysteine ligase